MLNSWHLGIELFWIYIICRSTSSHICKSTSSHICRSTSLHVCRSLLSLTVCLPLALLSFCLSHLEITLKYFVCYFVIIIFTAAVTSPFSLSGQPSSSFLHSEGHHDWNKEVGCNSKVSEWRRNNDKQVDTQHNVPNASVCRLHILYNMQSRTHVLANSTWVNYMCLHDCTDSFAWFCWTHHGIIQHLTAVKALWIFSAGNPSPRSKGVITMV